MSIPYPFSRAQQILGVPEHPCEAIVKNGVIYAPYEEMEIRWFPEHAGAILALYVGEDDQPFGGGEQMRATLLKGYLPVVAHETAQAGCRIRQQAYACLIEGETVADGTEPLILMVGVEAENRTENAVKLPLTVRFGSCFVPQETEDDYWKNFLFRDDIPANPGPNGELPAYRYPLTERGGRLYAEPLGLLMVPEGGEPSRNAAGAIDGWRFTLNLAPGEAGRVFYRLPYYPLDASYAPAVASMDYDGKLAETAATWDKLLGQGMRIEIPGTAYDRLWKAQTAATFILIDRQNKGSSSLYGGEMYRTWAGRYPDKVLCYPHLSPSLSSNAPVGTTPNKSSGWVLPIIIIAIIFVLGGAGTAVYFLIIKKKNAKT